MEPSKGFNRTFAGNKQQCRYNGQWSWRCEAVGEIYDTGQAVRWGWGGRDEIGLTEKEFEAGKWAVVMVRHQENISTTERKQSWSVFYWRRYKKKKGVNLRESLYLADWKVNVVEHIACSVQEPPVSRTTMRVLEPGTRVFLWFYGF